MATNGDLINAMTNGLLTRLATQRLSPDQLRVLPAALVHAGGVVAVRLGMTVEAWAEVCAVATEAFEDLLEVEDEVCKSNSSSDE